GVAGFSGLTLDRAALDFSIAATGCGLTGATSSAITVTPATPAQLVITMRPPALAAAGTPFGLSVAIEDAFGNVETTDDGQVTISLSGGPGGASLGGTLTVMAGQGVARFSGLTMSQAGAGYTIEAGRHGLPGVTSDPISVVPAAPAQLVIAAQPPGSITAGAG